MGNLENVWLVNDNILVKLEGNGGDRRTATGLYLASSAADERIVWGQVVAVGDGRVLDNGDRLDMTVEVGDQVCFPKFNSSEVTYDGEKLYVLPESNVLLIS